VHRHQHRVAQQFASLEERVERAGEQVVLVADGHVGLAPEHRGQRLLGLHLRQVQQHMRRGAGQRGPGSWHDRRRRRRERGQHDAPRDLVAQRRQVGLGRAKLGQ
jgi:hypothetical protein